MKKIFSLPILLTTLVFFGGIALLYTINSSKKQSPTSPSISYDEKAPVETKDDVVVQQLSISASEKNNIPEGVPQDLPIEKRVVIEGYVANYNQKSVSQYSFSYKSALKKEQIISTYVQYMLLRGYIFGENGRNDELGSLYATRNNDSLLVVTEPSGESVKVNITFLDRK